MFPIFLMYMRKLFLGLVLLLTISVVHATEPSKGNVPFTTIHFLSLDGMKMTADYHEINPEAPIIVLCHQAGYSRGEYIEIAAQLNSFGFNCFAIDQRAGKSCNGLVNETAKYAKERGRPTSYLDAEQDILAAISHVTNKYFKNDVILWGSSYSAALALKIGVSHPNVSTVIAYSPGEYLEGIDLQSTITSLTKPTYVTSSHKEAKAVKVLISKATQTSVVQFVPEGNGVHGSKALWRNAQDNGEYWASIYMFLKELLPE
ncbi:MAG: pimeloyl-ACP methyl ester carboxylesterase [Flavobacteriales bacterium]|jgi:pimeloyl-ACP methyl ester carboxylesterase